MSEIFDHWDNTLQTGNDIEYSTVIVALIAGAVLGLAHVAAAVLRTVVATFSLSSLFVACLVLHHVQSSPSVIPRPNLSESDLLRHRTGLVQLIPSTLLDRG